jgi:DNA polymerase-3 subunit delta'
MHFADIRHQDRALSIIRRALCSGRSHHAYLFEGPEGVGKESTAVALAARLMCDASGLEPDADACGQCPQCRTFTSGNHPDYHLIDRRLHKLHPDPNVRRSKGLFLAVDVVRHFLIAPAGLKPTVGRARVFLIRDAERMNDGAQNALLKTLEEPPGASRLILVTTSAARLLPTIRSRCQIVAFDPLPPQFVAERLRAETDMDAAAAHTFARLCDGRLGAALRWHRIGLSQTIDDVSECLNRLDGLDPQTFGKSLIEAAESLARRTMALEKTEETQVELPPSGTTKTRRKKAAPAKAPKAAAGKTVPTDEFRAAMKLTLMLVAAIFRDVLIVQSGGDVALTALSGSNPLVERLSRGAASADDPETCLRAVAEAETMLDRNVNSQLLCERLAAALTGAPLSSV